MKLATLHVMNSLCGNVLQKWLKVYIWLLTQMGSCVKSCWAVLVVLDDNEETGWKYIHGDVFRFPPHKNVFCAFVGTGAQVILCCSLLFAMKSPGPLSPPALTLTPPLPCCVHLPCFVHTSPCITDPLFAAHLSA